MVLVFVFFFFVVVVFCFFALCSLLVSASAAQHLPRPWVAWVPVVGEASATLMQWSRAHRCGENPGSFRQTSRLLSQTLSSLGPRYLRPTRWLSSHVVHSDTLRLTHIQTYTLIHLSHNQCTCTDTQTCTLSYLYTLLHTDALSHT